VPRRPGLARHRAALRPTPRQEGYPFWETPKGLRPVGWGSGPATTWGQDRARIAAPWLTHRSEDRPAASGHGAPQRVRLRGDCLSPIASGNGSRIMSPGAGARVPGMVRPGAHLNPYIHPEYREGWALKRVRRIPSG
jgi:hypothetical protein